MKKIVLATVVLGLFAFGYLGVANALFLSDGTDVGDPDDYLGYTTGMIPSDANELVWIKSMTGESYDSLVKTEVVGVDWEQVYTDKAATTLDPGTYAFELQTYQPAYWLIKTGNVTPGSGDTQVHYLFENVASLDWAVFNLGNEEFSYTLSGIGQVSHVSEAGGVNESGANPFPEPATMLLFGAGLAGLTAVARRRKAE